MSSRLISSVHIEKLGHKLQEIRERALLNILQKLKDNFVYDNELARSKELLLKLFQWFTFKPCTYKTEALQLIQHILQSSSGTILLKHYGSKWVLTEINKIRTLVKPPLTLLVQEILDYIEHTPEIFHNVPLLQSDLPLSYRSSLYESEPIVDSTATVTEGFIQESCQTGLQTGVTQFRSDSSKASTATDINFRWQSLITPDRHVLESVEQALRNPTEPMALLHSCDFFHDVILQDFPAEIFLQRPAIVLLLQEYLQTCVSKRLANSILKSLCKLTDYLIIRVNHYKEPCMLNSKDITNPAGEFENLSPTSTINFASTSHSYFQNNRPVTSMNLDKDENHILLEQQQLHLPQHCFKMLQCLLEYISTTSENYSVRNQTTKSINLSLTLFDRTIYLLSLSFKPTIWIETKDDPISLEAVRTFKETLLKIADVLEHFRLEAISNDFSNTSNQSIYLRLLCSCTNLLLLLVPLSKAESILSRPLKNVLANMLLDPVLAWMYPNVHETILQFVSVFDSHFETDSLEKYKQVKSISNSLSAAVKLLRNSKSLHPMEAFQLAREAIPSLEFHKNYSYINLVIDLCANRLHECDAFDISKDCILLLLAHSSPEVQEETYKLCCKIVVTAVGPRFNATKIGVPGHQILFLLSTSILTEICLHGITNKSPQIQKYANDIMIHIIKCKILVSDCIWVKAVEALIGVLPVLTCYAGKTSALGRTIVSILDPDTAALQLIPLLEVVKGNLRLLYINEPLARDESISRLCWLLASQENSKNLLPHFNTLEDKTLSTIFQVKGTFDVNKMTPLQHFYQPNTLFQVLELLNSANVEPIIRRSAVTQISVMLEDHLLHSTFLENDGLDLVINIMRYSLEETCYEYYVDCIIPVVTILKNICVFNATVRHELANNMDVYFYVIRGLFIFCAEDRMRQDSSILLSLLLFNDFILGSAVKSDFSLPYLILDKLCLSLICSSHWTVSPNTLPALETTLLSNKWCLNYIQIQFNADWFGGLNTILNWKEAGCIDSQFNKQLNLSNSCLSNLKNSSLSHCIEKYLLNVQNGTSHDYVIESVTRLEGYLQLYSIVKHNSDLSLEKLLEFPWESTFSRILNVPPSTKHDILLLTSVLKFLTILIPYYSKHKDKKCWVISILKNPTHCLPNLLQIDSSPELELKILHQELLNLIALCIRQEQDYFSLYTTKKSIQSNEQNWNYILEIIAENLKFNDTQHFYNLAYVDSLLSCLVHITTTFSCCTPNSPPKGSIIGLISSLCELINAFHSSKGPSAAASLMGLSITRYVLLVFNHLLTEMRSTGVKDWEQCFLGDHLVEQHSLNALCTLWLSRDVVVRAAILQLLSGFVISPRLAIELVKEIKEFDKSIWETALNIVLDNDEASIVRENAVMLLSNLISHIRVSDNQELRLFNFLIPNNFEEKEGSIVLLHLLDEHNFFKEVHSLLMCVHMKSSIYVAEISMVSPISSESATNCTSIRSIPVKGNIVTPSFVKATAIFMQNLLFLSPSLISNLLQDSGVLKMFFRCVSRPSTNINTTKNLSLYCDVLEMDIAICALLSLTAKESGPCFVALLQTRDCLSVLLSLLNPLLYCADLPQLYYLRNRLWSEIFGLIEILLNKSMDKESQYGVEADEVLSIISTALSYSGYKPFLETLCLSVSLNDCADLQQTALSSLTSLLRTESKTSITKDDVQPEAVPLSIQNLLDNIKTPRLQLTPSPSITKQDENSENIEPGNQNRTCRKVSNNAINKKENRRVLLQDVYFGKVSEKLNEFNKMKSIGERTEITNKCNEGNELFAGAELCRILLELYEFYNFNPSVQSKYNKRKTVITNTLTSIFSISREAKKFALQSRFLVTIIQQFRDLHVKLSLESVDCLRRVQDKKRVCPVLKELSSAIGLITNFMLESEEVKSSASAYGFADLIHKLWIWFCIDRALLCDALKMLCTYTTDCILACQSLSLTSSVTGSGPRKTPNHFSLIYELITLISREMDSISRTHVLKNLELVFHILRNTCTSTECRVILAKSNVLQAVSRLHPANTKRQKPWDEVELIWLKFLLAFTGYPEGQAQVAKDTETLEFIMMFSGNSKPVNKRTALLVLRNVAFYQPNRSRLLNSGTFINILQNKLNRVSATSEEIHTIATIIWALTSNNQRAKLILKCAGIDTKLQELIKLQNLLLTEKFDTETISLIEFVFGLLKDGEKCR